MTTDTAPVTVTPDVANLARSFNTAAITPTQFGLETLFQRWSFLRKASARHDPDLLAGLSFSTVVDAVVDYRSRGDHAFDVLKVAK
jgi:hypothetical protein